MRIPKISRINHISQFLSGLVSREAGPRNLCKGIKRVQKCVAAHGKAWQCVLIAGMLAPDGRCKTLDASGNGYVRAETCVTILLEAAPEQEDIAAILCGSAVNQVKPHRLFKLNTY